MTCMLRKWTPMPPGAYGMVPSCPPLGYSMQPTVEKYPSWTARMGSLYLSNAARTFSSSGESLGRALDCADKVEPRVARSVAIITSVPMDGCGGADGRMGGFRVRVTLRGLQLRPGLSQSGRWWPEDG